MSPAIGFQIFVHSVKMVLRNFSEALKISLVPVAIGIVVLVAYATMAGDSAVMSNVVGNQGTYSTSYDGAYSGSVGGLILMGLVMIFIMLWIVVNWHRFVLLEEYPQGWVPPVQGNRIFAYAAAGLLLGLAAVLFMLPVGFIVGMTGGNGIAIAIMVVFWLVIVVNIYRLSIILPAAAIGRPLGFIEAWEKTMGSFWTIVVLMVTSFVFQFVIQFVFGFLALIPVIGPILILFPSLLVLPLINVSVLTTMYGVFVEGRSLD